MKITLAFCSALLLSALAHGAVTSTVVFETNAQSMWDTGSGTTFDYQESLRKSLSTPQIRIPPLSPLNMYGQLDGSSEIGVDVNLKFDSGTVDAVVPYEAGLDFSYTEFSAGQFVTINTFADLDSANASLQTRFPKLEFSTDLVANLSGQVGAQGCVGIPFVISKCAGASYDFDLGEARTELIAINRDGDSEVRLVPDLQAVLGSVKAKVKTEKIKDPVTGEVVDEKTKLTLRPAFGAGLDTGSVMSAEVSLPDFGTSYDAAAGLDVLTTKFNSDTFLDLNVDVDALLTSAGLLPPLEINASLKAGPASVGLSANLLDVDLDAAFSVGQTFTLTPELMMDLSFARDVTVRLNGDVKVVAKDQLLSNAFTTDPAQPKYLRAGQDAFEILWDNAGALQITPDYILGATLTNTTSLDLGLALGIEALSASASVSILGYNAGKTGFGPLIDETYDLTDLIGAPSIDIFNDTFDLGGFQSRLMGNVITLDTSGAVFTGEGANRDWRDVGNWGGATAPDTGRDVVIDLQNVTGGITNPLVGAGDSVNVGNLTIGSDAGVTVAGTLNQDSGAKLFSNAGSVAVFGIPSIWEGTLGIGAPVSGGGVIFMQNGTLNATSSAGLDLQGQTIVGIGNDAINVANVLRLNDKSAIVSTGTMSLNASNYWGATNAGIIQADGGSLYWNANTDQAVYYINNNGGEILATNGGTVSIDRNDGLYNGNPGRIQVAGGTLTTDAISSIIFKDDLFLSDTPHIDGNVTVQGALKLVQNNAGFGVIRNDGFLSFDSMTVQNLKTYLFSGDGIAQINGGRIDVPDQPGPVIAGICPFCVRGPNLPGSASLINSDGHTLQGSGDIWSDITLINQGTVSANSSTAALTIYANTTNTGTLSATGTGGLVINGTLDTTTGRVTASGGNVTINGTLTGGSTTGPGGVWTADNASIRLENGANQWASLANDYSVLRGGEIVLVGNNSRFFVNGTSLEDHYDGIDAIGASGKLTLVNKLFNRSDLLTNGRATIAIDGILELVNAEIDTGSALVGSILNPKQQLGRLNVGATGTVMGYGTIDSNVFNGGLVRAEGGRLTIEGDIAGSGTFAVSNGSTLELDLGHCTIFGFNCPFTRNVVAAGQIDGNRFVVDSLDAWSTLQLTGTDTNPFISSLKGAEIQLNGEFARVLMVSTNQGTRTLGQTMQSLDGSALLLSGGKDLVATNAVSLTNGSTLGLADAGTSYTGPSLSVLSASRVDMLGGTLDVNALNVSAGSAIEGFGTITGPNTVSSAGAILANDGVLQIANSTLTQTGAGRLEATDTDFSADATQPRSVLRLTDSTVNGGEVRVGINASLSGNGKFSNVTATNAGTILASNDGDGITAFTDSSIDNQTGGLIRVSDATLSLARTELTNAASAKIQVVSQNDDPADSVLRLADATITGGTLELTSVPVVTLDTQTDSDGNVFDVRIESASATRAILEGYGTLSNVDLVVDNFSLVDANVSGESLVFDIGTGSITNLGLMQASDGGILRLSGGTIAGTGNVLALAGSVVEIQNMTFEGVTLGTQGGGVIRDIANSTYINSANTGTFEVVAGGVVNYIGNLNNIGGLVHVRDGGIVNVEKGDPANDAPDRFTLDGGRLMIDEGGKVNGDASGLALLNTAVGGFGVINSDVYATTGSSIEPGDDAMAGLLTIAGDLTTEVGSQIILDVFGLGTGMFDQLLVGGALNLAGTVMLNFMDDSILEQFAQQRTVFDLFLGGTPDKPSSLQDASLFELLTFQAMSKTSLTALSLADGGSGRFIIGATDPIADQVPEPGVLALFFIGLLLFSMQARRVSRYRPQRAV